MIKLLINCSFGHFPLNKYSFVENFSLILAVPIDTKDLRIPIAEKLIELNFNLGRGQVDYSLINRFTSQKI